MVEVAGMAACEHCEALQQGVNQNRDGLKELTAATNGKLDRVHQRIDRLLYWIMATMAMGVLQLAGIIVTAVLMRGGN